MASCAFGDIIRTVSLKIAVTFPSQLSSSFPYFVVWTLFFNRISSRIISAAPYKANQDEFSVITPKEYGTADTALFGVYDGHGHVGEKCARFTKAQLPPAIIAASDKFTSDQAIKSTMTKVFIDVNKKLHSASDIDDTLSGTTAVVAMVMGGTVW